MNKKIVLEKDYIPNEEEPFMSDKQLEYFRKKLIDWKSEILDGAISVPSNVTENDIALSSKVGIG